MVFEYIEKNLLEILEENPNGLDPENVRHYMYQVFKAIEFCHRNNVIHRDIKLENILISAVEDRSEYEIRIADFGLALFTPNDELVSGKCGSPGYVAPEVFKGL